MSYRLLLLFMMIMQTLSNNDFQLPLKQQNGIFTTTIDFQDKKKANIQVDISSSQLIICCKPNSNIFQIVYYFLLNPFSLSYENSCHDNSKAFQVDTIVLPTIGVIEMEFNESRKCQTGTIGLNKQSMFLKTLPLQKKAFTIVIKGNGNANTVQLYFGSSVNTYSKNSQFILDAQSSSDNWIVNFLSSSYELIQFNQSQVLFTTNQKGLFAPKPFFKKIRDFLLNFRQCILGQQQNIFCPCQSGAPQNYPDLIFGAKPNFSISIHASQYMEVNSAVCRVLIFESDNEYWSMNLLLLNNQQLQFNYQSSKITISSLAQNNSGADSIKLPIQLILNCFVILVMCVFVAMIIIEIVKRISGLAEVRTQTFRQVMMRREL